MLLFPYLRSQLHDWINRADQNQIISHLWWCRELSRVFEILSRLCLDCVEFHAGAGVRWKPHHWRWVPGECLEVDSRYQSRGKVVESSVGFAIKSPDIQHLMSILIWGWIEAMLTVLSEWNVGVAPSLLLLGNLSNQSISSQRNIREMGTKKKQGWHMCIIYWVLLLPYLSKIIYQIGNW